MEYKFEKKIEEIHRREKNQRKGQENTIQLNSVL
jgi:hypothetical protein